jgi:hypothetical protein
MLRGILATLLFLFYDPLFQLILYVGTVSIQIYVTLHPKVASYV